MNSAELIERRRRKERDLGRVAFLKPIEEARGLKEEIEVLLDHHEPVEHIRGLIDQLAGLGRGILEEVFLEDSDRVLDYNRRGDKIDLAIRRLGFRLPLHGEDWHKPYRGDDGE